MLRGIRPVAAGAAGLVLLATAACSSASPGGISNPGGSNSSASQPSSAVQTVAKATGRYSTPDLVKATAPAVVRIQTSVGVGTGFFVSDDGYIMTNNHVVQTNRGPASTVQVTMDDGTILTGTVKGTDAKSDMALVKVDGSGYPFLKFASLDATNVGDDVIAIGYALDLGAASGPGAPTVTEGIISAKNRAIDEGETASGTGVSVLGSIQTDAAINHGNSGGPLVNYDGDVVGINTSLVPDEDGSTAIGIGLAVGSDTANAVFQQLRDNGSVQRGFLGISGFQSIKAAKDKQLGVPTDIGGVYLPTAQDLQAAGVRGAAGATTVQAGSPAADAGLQPGDVITKIADTVIHDQSDLAVALIKHHPGENVTIEYYRNNAKQTTTLTLGTPPTT